ncbi:hypothetical protein IV63_GL000090 [Companilactobacillus crustorum]|uniref:Uncharacterized protein n=1 Tax=Companilactobacillus crustorum TaxID=392416 RepID=A0ABR5QFT4_9LACO|nr:hypothetical protein IV63_GL000090 [Companilactobacillus crustorum]
MIILLFKNVIFHYARNGLERHGRRLKPIEIQIVSKSSLILGRQKSPTKNNLMT